MLTRDENRAKRVRYIDRWRLEKKNPAAVLSDPVKPIVYYIDAATPVKWRDAICKWIYGLSGIPDQRPRFRP